MDLPSTTSSTGLTGGRAFTLPELLVVIGIIALILGMLIPVVSRARQSATALRCKSNLHQVGIAMQNYGLTNRGKFLPWFPVGASRYSWPEVIFGEPRPTILLCPTALESEWLSYELNDMVSPQMWLSNVQQFKDRSSNEVIIAGENVPGTNIMYGGSPSSDGRITWDPARHGRFRSNYLFLDFHVDNQLPRTLPYLQTPWQNVWRSFLQ